MLALLRSSLLLCLVLGLLASGCDLGTSSARDSAQGPLGAGGYGNAGHSGSAGSSVGGGITTSGPSIPLAFSMKGTNLAGAEFGSNLPGMYDLDYTYPTHAEVDYFVGKGMTALRMPFAWERLQPVLSTSLDAAEQARVDDFVSYATGKGAYVILDPHNYARYQSNAAAGPVLIGAAGGPTNADFADLWSRLATLYAANDHVIFGLMNEPHDIGLGAWLTAANSAIDAIRAAGATNLILVPGTNWTGAASWTDSNTGMLGTIDPLDHYVFEVHQYNDSDSSGNHSTCVSATIGSERLQNFTEWLSENGKQAVLGEFDGPNNDTCLSALDDMLSFIDAHTDSWVGWTYWAAGPWWGPQPATNGSIIEPSGGMDAPQMPILVKHL
ncbi:MAG TPA: glycoside hydrolase family 5 protein [Polyangiaceae bacterium]|jgi:endoglucanase